MTMCDSSHGSRLLLSENTSIPLQPASSLHRETLVSSLRYSSPGIPAEGGQVVKTLNDRSTLIACPSFLDPDAYQRICRDPGGDRGELCAARKIEAVHVRREIVGGPEGAVADEVESRPERPFGRHRVRLGDNAVVIEARDDFPARYEDAAVRQYAKVLRHAAGDGGRVEIRELRVGADVELLHVRTERRVDHRAAVGRDV